jgi:hypothetical protein
MSAAFMLRVFHPTLSPRDISESFGLPPHATRRDGGTYWETRLAGDETGRGTTDAALADIAARFAHYRYFVDDICDGGGRVEIAVAGGEPPGAAMRARFEGLGIFVSP